MWGLIVIAFIWYGLFGKNNPKTVRKVQEGTSKSGCAPVLVVLFVLSVASSLIPGLLGLAIAAVALGLPVMLIGKLISAANKEATRRNSKEYKSIPENFSLTQSVSKRQKILRNFNEEYELNLGDEQMERIVDASYMSYSWEKEIYDMTKVYKHPSEWYRSDTAWLRAYLRAFPMMSITSDFEMQRSIVEDAFRQILTELPPGNFMNIDAAIEETNRRFFTLFDEASYMIMFRYMQTRGMDLKFPNGLHHMESEADRLAREYDEKVAAEAKKRKAKTVRNDPTERAAAAKQKKETEEERLAREREEALDDLQAFAEEQMGGLSDEDLERLIKAYDKMAKEEGLDFGNASDDGSDDTDPNGGGMRGY